MTDKIMISRNYRCRSLFDGFLCIFNLKKVTIRWKNSDSSVVSGTHVFAACVWMRSDSQRRLEDTGGWYKIRYLFVSVPSVSDLQCNSEVYWIYLHKNFQNFNKTIDFISGIGFMFTWNKKMNFLQNSTGYCNIIFFYCVPCNFVRLMKQNMTNGIIFFYSFFLTIKKK